MTHPAEWIIYLAVTYLINIVALNVLIAILSDTYDSVQASLQAFHTKTQIGILSEVGYLLYWNRGYDEVKYLHFVHYSYEQLSATGADGQWEGRVKVIVN